MFASWILPVFAEKGRVFFHSTYQYHSVRCGLLKYEIELQLHWRFSQIERHEADILYIGWMYVVGSRILHPEASRWPDKEFPLHGRQEKLLFGDCPKTIKKAVKKLYFGRGYSIANLASNRRSEHETPSSNQNSNKSWVGDLRLNKLLNESNPTIMLMHPGPVSFSNIYANWSDDDKRESCVGRAVWHAMREFEPVNDTPVDGDELGEHSGSRDDGTEEIDEAASDAGSDISVQEFSFNLNALAENGSNNNIIFMGNGMSQPVSINHAQMFQLRAAPNGGFVLGGRAPSQASRIEMLPPRQSEHARAIASAEDAPELCACGLSRYGVSIRPIPKMNTKAAKLEHQCMGALFVGIDVPDRDLGDAIKVRRFKIPGSQRRTEEK
ncbi:hypothetical protein BKA58DRAFT_319902 [Alternaria rosae]|uniref:uncharacterized protein n=1 Tax=Alternaria rosae TaxID=1187941 RepID=UPI001E8E004B|nr:uncharacterized protein BKA58DRAFT_319902 [Alternaria rosae]KAH6866328.1 hypothetical protein BKA58DRAFT_319902 [Alternaria rosae]